MVARDGIEPPTPAFSGLDAPMVITFKTKDQGSLGVPKTAHLLGQEWDKILAVQNCLPIAAQLRLLKSYGPETIFISPPTVEDLRTPRCVDPLAIGCFAMLSTVIAANSTPLLARLVRRDCISGNYGLQVAGKHRRYGNLNLCQREQADHRQTV